LKLTPDQRRVIEHRGSSLLVSASAGSGKTEVLARRCVDLIADATAPCRVDQLLVVTFTRAAAAELRVRIARMLRERAETEPAAPMRRHLRRQEMLVDTADIGTIDAWCQRVVREHFDVVEIDPAFGILGEQEAGLMRIETLDRVMRWVYTADDPIAAAARDWLAGEPKPSDDYLRAALSDLNRCRERLIDDTGWFQAQAGFWARDIEALRADAERCLGAALAEECAFQRSQLAPIVAQVRDPRARAMLDSYAGQLEAWAAAAVTPARLMAAVAAIDAVNWRKPPKLNEPDGVIFAEVRDDWWERRLAGRWGARDVALVFEHLEPQAARIRCLLAVESRYHDQLWQAKQRRNALEFGDVLRLTVRLMRDGALSAGAVPSIAEHLRARYAHILVDEYQDTSPLQAEMLRSLTRRPPAETNRFMVGDIKQSIYGFRDADPRLFAQQADRFDQALEPGETVLLRDSFRSHERLVAGINRLFGALFDRELGGTDYDEHEQLRARRDEPDHAPVERGARIRVHLLPEVAPSNRAWAAGDSGAPEELIEREARVIASLIRVLLSQGTLVPQRDEHDLLTLRPAALGDIVILLRSAKVNAGRVAGVLRREGIACVAAGRESILDSREVADARAVLSLLVNRRHDVAMAAYLRGPLVELSATDLLKVRRARPRGDFSVAALAYAAETNDELARRLRAAFDRLDAWRVMARDAELPVLIRRVIRESHLSLFARGLPGGAHRAAVLEALETMSAEFAEREQGGVAEFVEYLDALSDENVPQATSVTTSEDVVRIMTIHASKGLEFPFVFLAAAGASVKPRSGDERIVCDETHGIGMKAFDVRRRAHLITPAYPVITGRKAQNELEEELRLLYVAATRARERLYVVGHGKGDLWNKCRTRFADGGALPLISRLAVRSTLEWVLMAVSASRADQAAGGKPPLVEVAQSDPDLPLNAGEPNTLPDEAIVRPLSTEESERLERADELITAELDMTLARSPAAISVSALKADQDASHPNADRPRLPVFGASVAADGRELGTATHRLLEVADMSDLDTADAVRDQCARWVTAGRLSPTQADLIDPDAIAWFAGTDLGRSVATASKLRREVPFVYALPDAQAADRVILRGVIDCMIECDEGTTILDYKTDRVDPVDAAERVAMYARQLRAYAMALGDLCDGRVMRAVLVFLHARKLVEVDIGPQALQRLMQDWRAQRGTASPSAVL
jgi:ATP-dependent helicase/nuclease subunit A